MIGVVVIAHAPLASAFVECARHVYCDAPHHCTAVDVAADADVAAEVERAKRIIDEVDEGDGVLVFTDAYGASPGNVAAKLIDAASRHRVAVVAGLNLPMLLRTLCHRESTPLPELVEKAVGGGASGIIKIATTPQQEQRPFSSSPADPDGHARLADQQ